MAIKSVIRDQIPQAFTAAASVILSEVISANPIPPDVNEPRTHWNPPPNKKHHNPSRLANRSEPTHMLHLYQKISFRPTFYFTPAPAGPGPPPCHLDRLFGTVYRGARSPFATFSPFTFFSFLAFFGLLAAAAWDGFPQCHQHIAGDAAAPHNESAKSNRIVIVFM